MKLSGGGSVPLYFQARVDDWSSSDQTVPRDVIPVDRLRAYDVRNVIDGMFDDDSVLEIRKDFGVGMITALARVEGRPVGVIAITLHTLPVRSIPMEQTKQLGSCSYVTLTVCQSSP